jgi:hypothetical protein
MLAILPALIPARTVAAIFASRGGKATSMAKRSSAQTNGRKGGRPRKAKGLENRQRDRDGEVRHKRSDTRVETLRKTYGDNFAPGYRSDTKLSTVLRKEHVDTLDQLLKRRHRVS